MPRPHKWALAIATSIPFAAILYAFSLGPSPEKALAEFYANQGAEDTLVDPLILAGDDVVPLVIAEIARKDMIRRRYAIAFLGDEGHRAALPALETILADETELDYLRADALRSILLIDKTRGRQLAAAHASRSDLLGDSARSLARGESPERRTVLDAVTQRHD